MARKVATVFGATGFLGRHVVRRLANAGWIVRAVTRDMENAQFLRPAGNVGQIVPWPANILKPDQVAEATADVDVVINLVGILYESGARTFPAVHVKAAESIAQGTAAGGAKALVHVSALGADKMSPADYARTKAMGEDAVLAAYPNAVVLRPSVVFGPEDNFFNLFASMSRFSPVLPVFGCPTLPSVKLFGPDGAISVDLYGDGGPKFQPVYVGDVADAVMKGLDDKAMRGQTYELGGPRVYTFKEIMELVLETARRKRFLMPVPFWLGELQAFFLEKLPKPLLTRDQIELMKRDNVCSGSLPGFADMDIRPTAAEAILPTYMHHYHTPAAREAEKAASS